LNLQVQEAQGTVTPTIKKRKTTCSVCAGEKLVNVLDLPKFPFTGIFLSSPDDSRYRGVDQEFMLCRECGHGQLRNIIDPRLVYDESYKHRSSWSPIATSGNDFFLSFLQNVTRGKTFRRILEIGCNDLYLLKKLESLGNHLVGVDPIWHGNEPDVGGKIKILGKFVEEVNFHQELGGEPDLIISAHTLEHIENPMDQLNNIVDVAADEAIFVIEVPGFDSLMANCRIDQIFHQHIQYFSLASFERLIYEIGGDYLTHNFNSGYWGGTMLVAFKKAAKRSRSFQGCFICPNVKVFRKNLKLFRDQIENCMRIIDSLKTEIMYGYGAAQMLPTIAYHMKSDMSFLKSVLDDNPERHGLMYPGMPIVIQKPEAGLTLEGANVLITALDSIRPIMKRAIGLRAKRIILPLHMV